MSITDGSVICALCTEDRTTCFPCAGCEQLFDKASYWNSGMRKNAQKKYN